MTILAYFLWQASFFNVLEILFRQLSKLRDQESRSDGEGACE